MPSRRSHYFAVPRFCGSCGADLADRDVAAQFCSSCIRKRATSTGAANAHTKVHLAVKSGRLAAVGTLACADCGGPAHHYDHRDYGKPLEVEPVCRSCNSKRGPARPVLTFELPDAIPT